MVFMNKDIYKGIIYAGLFAVPFIAFLVFSSLFFPYITSKAFVFRIIVEVVFAAWLVLAFIDPVYRPKKSPILYSLAAFLVVIGLADIVGVTFGKSFWSNFERMEGYVALLHLGAYFLVASSVFREVDWKRWWNTSLVASLLMVVVSLRDVLMAGGQRIDGTFGNPTYLAVYMLLHIFIAAFFLWKGRKNKLHVWMYSLLILAQTYILYNTGTRGAVLGLMGGVVVVALLNLRNRSENNIRKVSIAALGLVIVLVGGFWFLRNTSFVQESPFLVRFANITTEELQTGGRSFVWPMAVKGVKDRPILGWGQENFNYVFSTYYDPDMHDLEPWFDRAHNIFLDWAVAGGVLGLLAYLSLYVVLLYVLWRPSRGEGEDREESFSHMEKSIITGLVAAYFIHNFFVFDHLISYILFFSLLAYIHSSSTRQRILTKVSSNEFAHNLALIAVAIGLALSIYFLNVKPLRANMSLINAFQNMQMSGQARSAIENFEKSYNMSVLGRTEVSEQLSIHAPNLLSGNISVEEKNKFFKFTRTALIKVADEFPSDARIQITVGSFLVRTGQFDEANVYLSRAKKLAPNRQSVYFEIGNLYINKGEYDRALDEFAQAYTLAPLYREAQVIYLIGSIYAGERELERRLIEELGERDFAFEDRILSTYISTKRLQDAISMLEKRIALDPANTAKYRQYIESVKQ